MRSVLYFKFIILAITVLAACAHYTPKAVRLSSSSAFPESSGKWWYNSYFSSNCKSYNGYKSYTELTGKIIVINDTPYYEMLWIANADFNASKSSMLKNKQLSMAGIRQQDGKYFIHSEQLVKEGFGEQLLFDANTSISDSWSMYWKSSLIRYDFTLTEKKFNSVLEDTLYTLSVNQYPTASHVPELEFIVISPKYGILSQLHTDVEGKFYSIREDVAPALLLDSCD